MLLHSSAPHHDAATESSSTLQPPPNNLPAFASPHFTAVEPHDAAQEDVPSGSISCPTCASTYLSEAAYITHLQLEHRDAPDLTVYQLDI